MKTYGEEMAAMMGQAKDGIAKAVRTSLIWTTLFIIALVVLVWLNDYPDALILALAWIALSLIDIAYAILGSVGVFTAIYGMKSVHEDRVDKQNRARVNRIESALRTYSRRHD